MDFYEKIEKHIAAKLPLVVYRKPSERLIHAILQKDDELKYLNDFTESGFIFAPFDSEKRIVLMRSDENFRFEPSINADHRGFVISSPVEVNTDQKDFHIGMVKEGIAKIDEGVLQKVVLSRRFTVDVNSRPVELFKRLSATYPNAFCYLWYHPKVGLWLGATPEILMTLENTRFTTTSLAGTQPYNDSKAPSWGKKEIEEQALVTDYILGSLKDKVTDLVQSETESVRAGKLWHLRTKITGVLAHENLENIIKALHPTPAVCGLPKLTAKEFITNHEGYDREFYTGFLGELNFSFNSSKKGDRADFDRVPHIRGTKSSLYVNLRCTKITNKSAFVYVGGGITRSSEPEDEWEETIAKSKTVLQALQN
ncbi:chorismate-binding protein [Pareuzebyella sediminis]|uniref:chorismate-binding protein n=1 Tax=Pareuzebyella sediminis TaxID=2607998 RepID=UPI0011ED818A|nr:chorismate-binding protein [Pareuzebyella sediminis]